MSTHVSLMSSMVDDTTVIRFVGEIDITNVDAVSAQVGPLWADAKALALDFTDLTYVDSAGVRFIDDLACRCEQRGTQFLIVVPKAARNSGSPI